MSLSVGDVAPAFKVVDSYKRELSLEELKGKKVWLSLYRSSACPLCNYQLSKIRKRYDEFTAAGLQIISVFESTIEEIEDKHAGTLATMDFPVYCPGEGTPDSFPMYEQYGRVRSCAGSIYGCAPCYHCCVDCKMVPAAVCFGANPKFGCPLFEPCGVYQLMCSGSRVVSMPTDVLIDEDGKIVALFRGRFSGEHIAMEEVEAFAGIGGTAAPEQANLMERK
jgi:peroxiredoxin